MSAFRAAILCGGAGTRLWPLSRDAAPKQFHPLVGDLSLLSETVQRAGRIPGAGAPMILAGEAFEDTTWRHVQAAGAAEAELILETAPRNTAPAAALAAFRAAEDDPSTIIALLPSDHHIADEVAFLETVAKARELAADGAIVTLGIVPDAPLTGYGYIRQGEPIGQGFKVARFVEKPDAERARGFLKEGGYYWNAGIFLFRADAYLGELQAYRPDIFEAAQKAWVQSSRRPHGRVVDRSAWADCPSDSIDYAVAEKTDRAVVVPADIGWNDVGSWSSLMDLAARDADENAVFGNARTSLTKGSYVRASSRHVSVIGATDLIVVETEDAVLVVHKDAVQHVKDAAAFFKAQTRS